MKGLTLMDIRQLQGENDEKPGKAIKANRTEMMGGAQRAKAEDVLAPFRRWKSMDLNDVPAGSWPEFID